MDISRIARGFIANTRNEFGVGDPEVEQMAVARYRICLGCPLISDSQQKCDKKKSSQAVIDFNYDGKKRYKGNDYSGCNCVLAWKTRVEEESCPLGKWLSVKL